MVISRTAKINIKQTMIRENISWFGDLNSIQFLSRLYDLESLPSFDPRFKTAHSDIATHTVSFHDWDDDWIYDDSRFNLMNCDDDVYLKFLCESIHPVVRKKSDEATLLMNLYNHELNADGYKITMKISSFGNLGYEATRINPDTISAFKEIQKTDYLSTHHVQSQISRMMDNIESDPELAIGTAKEFVETISKTILNQLSISFEDNTDLHKLVRTVLLTLNPLDISSDDVTMQELQRKISGSLTTLVLSIAELRNKKGTGHGKSAEHMPIKKEIAHLAVNSASTIGLFMVHAYDNYNLK